MRILAVILSVLLGSNSFALAQTSSSGSSPAAGQATRGSTAAPTETTGGANSRATPNATVSQGSNPTNALDDNRVAPTTGNPLIQSGKVK